MASGLLRSLQALDEKKCSPKAQEAVAASVRRFTCTNSATASRPNAPFPSGSGLTTSRGHTRRWVGERPARSIAAWRWPRERIATMQPIERTARAVCSRRDTAFSTAFPPALYTSEDRARGKPVENATRPVSPSCRTPAEGIEIDGVQWQAFVHRGHNQPTGVHLKIALGLSKEPGPPQCSTLDSSAPLNRWYASFPNTISIIGLILIRSNFLIE